MTTTPTAWAHLPNAAHIDRILAHLRTYPGRWDAARDAARDAAWGVAWGVAWGAARGAVWVVARDAAWEAARVAALDAAWGAAWVARDTLYALIAWDDCAYLLDLHPDALTMLIHTAPEPLNHQAVLLLPAAVALNT